MKYLSGIYALNTDCQLNTCGDWHWSSLNWKDPPLRESDNSLFGNYGIERDRTIPGYPKKIHVANHLRAILDLMEEGRFHLIRGMRRDYLCTDEYTEELFQKVSEMASLPHWPLIDQFMESEYLLQWRERGNL